MATGSNHARLAGRRGLTLIEILVSIAILAGSLAVILQAFGRGAYTLAIAKNRLRASLFCMAKMAEWQADTAHGPPEDGAGSFRVGRERFTWTVTTGPLPDEPGIAVVTLTTGWTQSGRPYTMQVSGLWSVSPESP